MPDLVQDDQLVLIKAGFFEVWLTRMARMFNQMENYVTFEDGSMIHRDELSVVYAVSIGTKVFEEEFFMPPVSFTRVTNGPGKELAGPFFSPDKMTVGNSGLLHQYGRSVTPPPHLDVASESIIQPYNQQQCRMHMLIFAYCVPHNQNRPSHVVSDTQIHVVLKNPEQFYMLAFGIRMSSLKLFFLGKSMKRRQRDNYVLCANLLSPPSCAKATRFYPILTTSSTCGTDSGVFDLKFMLSLSFCLRLIMLAGSLGPDVARQNVECYCCFFQNKGPNKTVGQQADLRLCWSHATKSGT